MKQQPSFTELRAFAAIVRLGSFRAAADELALSASTLSHLMRALEERLGLRLFNRTTRSVSPTEAGARLFQSVMPVLSELDRALMDVGSLRDKPSGQLRINASEEAARMLMDKVIPVFADRYPDIHLDLVIEGAFVDIVAEGFDAGTRLGEAVPRDMIAIPFGGDGRFLTVASPAYLRRNGTPLTPEELTNHQCIRFRLPSGKMYRWEFVRRGEETKIDVDGALTLDHIGLMVDAAIKGLGIAYVSAETAKAALVSGKLIAVLSDWTPPFSGHHLYYPSRRLMPAALRAFVDVLRGIDWRETAKPKSQSHRSRPPAKPKSTR